MAPMPKRPLMALQHSCLSKDRYQEVGNPMTIQTQMRAMSWQSRTHLTLETDEHRAEGKELYAIYCAVCHGSKGEDKGF